MPSSVVASITYDPLTSVLRVRFISGMVYDYKNVPEEVFRKMKGTSSKGTFLNQYIKGTYVFEKVSKV
jgi:hypothetical protein